MSKRNMNGGFMQRASLVVALGIALSGCGIDAVDTAFNGGRRQKEDLARQQAEASKYDISNANIRACKTAVSAQIQNPDTLTFSDGGLRSIDRPQVQDTASGHVTTGLTAHTVDGEFHITCYTDNAYRVTHITTH
jgi:hypothetical protein